GKLEAIHIPGGPGVRVDKAVYAGYFIPPYYDSMIAKLIVRARTREQAVVKMRHSLEEFVVQGVPTTIPFHLEIFNHPDFVAGKYDTSFIETKFRENRKTKEPKNKTVTLTRSSEDGPEENKNAAGDKVSTATDKES
ncbi:MAG: hypothetical protein GY867_04330, partial [bacterium]|nr:hypothetical protein [bacterium]